MLVALRVSIGFSGIDVIGHLRESYDSDFKKEKVKVKVKSLSHVWLFETPLTVAHQAPLSMGFSRQEHWSGLPFPSPGDLPDPGIEPGYHTLQADALPSETPGKLKKERQLTNELMK